MGTLDAIKLGVAGALVLIALGFGYHWGSSNVQADWDAAKAAAVLAEDKTRAADQTAADKAAKTTADKLSAQQTSTLNQTQDIANASKQNGACGSQPLSADSVQLYARTAASH